MLTTRDNGKLRAWELNRAWNCAGRKWWVKRQTNSQLSFIIIRFNIFSSQGVANSNNTRNNPLVGLALLTQSTLSRLCSRRVSSVSACVLTLIVCVCIYLAREEEKTFSNKYGKVIRSTRAVWQFLLLPLQRKWKLVPTPSSTCAWIKKIFSLRVYTWVTAAVGGDRSIDTDVLLPHTSSNHSI
jgi:hypothetical protein